MTSTESDDETTSSGFEGAHPSLASALAKKGYATATPVQSAVLAAADRDLLVSSQTGSGKTIAFGLVMGRLLLGDAARIAPSKQPRGLVIAPTRELAQQVQRELTWLFADAGARVAAFTGGTDLRGDSRTLSRGVDVAVGTPGRLVDLIERKSLDLSGVQVAVLDEADEMLDMGFREAIESLLSSVPAERRTLLFSATLPPAIRSLAKKFQKDSLSLDSGRVSRSASAHDDIVYTAHLCHSGERLAALVNVLRMADDERSLVFCRTREDVGELHRELASRGFLAAAISGDRAQSERDRALETMRQGRVRVLVATNVAARGLDLPELGLVVHSDLPENVEALTHRSGRTGRAGKKGRSLFLVEAGHRRRAERLFHAAGLKIQFSAPPGLDAVAKHDHDVLRGEVLAAAEAPIGEAAARIADELLIGSDPRALLGALIDRALKERPAGEPLTPVAIAASRTSAPPIRDAGGFVSFQINLGIADRAAANWILPLVCKRGNITRREVGAIRVARDRTYFEIASGAANEFAQNAAERDPRAPNVKIERAESMPSAPSGPPRNVHPRRKEGDAPAFAKKPAGTFGAGPTYRDKPRTAGYGGDKPRTAGYGGDKPRTAGYGGDKPRTAGYGGDKPRPGAYGGGKPKAAGHKPPPRKP